VIQFPLSRIIISLVSIFFVIIVLQSGIKTLLQSVGLENNDYLRLLSVMILSIATIFAYRFYVLLIEKRRVSELSTNGVAGELGFGVLIGAGLMAVSIGVIALLGGYHIIGTNDASVLIAATSLGIISGVTEEILFRGVLFRIMEERLGSYISLLVSSLIFGLLHIANPNATLFSSIAIAIEAGLLLGAAYMLTRRLWLAIGIHFAWNFTQGGIFGVNVSGTDVKGILKSESVGNELITGGAFGAEASLIALIICTSAGVWLLVQSIQKGNLIEPFWKKSVEAAS
jgi:hypothetical protein